MHTLQTCGYNFANDIVLTIMRCCLSSSVCRLVGYATQRRPSHCVNALCLTSGIMCMKQIRRLKSPYTSATRPDVSYAVRQNSTSTTNAETA